MPPKPVVLCILDGWGLRAEPAANAVVLADTPVYDRVMATGPSASLAAHGPDVGLPLGQMGNSEVGHTNIGAGRVVWMDLPRIDAAIADGAFATNPALGRFIAALRASGGTAHLVGLVSPGGVHAHEAHMLAAARVLVTAGLPVAVHAITDGRDVAPKSAYGQVRGLVAALPDGARVASVTGRFYAMDRDTRWDRVERAVLAMQEAEGRGAFSAAEAVMGSYDRGETDEFIQPTVLRGSRPMRDGDGLFCLNFRADRARELLAALLDPDFAAFARPRRVRFAASLGMVSYGAALDPLMPAMFPPIPLTNTLGAWVAAHHRTQLRLAETEKYPHVTFFLNAGVEAPYPGEARVMAPSPRVRTYDLAPEMAAAEVTAHLVGAIRGQAHDLIVANYANPDMVGHTGDLAAAIRACASVDRGLGAVVDALAAVGGAMLLTADHGNCELMVDPVTGGPHTAHTLNPVPVALVGGPPGMLLRDGGRLADLAPTLLALMGLPQPTEMTGRSLLVPR